MKNIVYLSSNSVMWGLAKEALKAEYAYCSTVHPAFISLKLPEEMETQQLIDAVKDLRIHKGVPLKIHSATDSSPYVIYNPDESDKVKVLLENTSRSSKKDDTSEHIPVLTGDVLAKIESGFCTPKMASALSYTKEDMKEVRDELEYATDKIAGLEDEIQEFKNDLKDSKKDNEILLDKIKKLVKEIEELESDKENLHKTIESLEDELRDANGKITDLEYDILKRDCMLDDYEDKLSKLTPDPDNRILIHDGVAYRY